MDDQPKHLQATVLFLGAVLAIVGVFAAAYFLYPLQREPRLIKRNYRLLAAIADQVGKRIEGLRRAVQTAQDDPNPNSACERAYVPGLKCVALSDLPAQLHPVPGSCRWEVEVHVHSDGRALDADFLARKGPKPKTQCTAAEESFLYLPTNLGKFLEEVVEPYGYFDTILLASAEGKVLYQSDVPIVDGRALYHSSVSTGRIAAIRDLINAEQTLGQKEEAGNQAESTKQAATPASYVFSPARFERVQYLGEEYLLFAQPVPSDVFVTDGDGQPRSTSLVLFGLVSSRSFSAETRQLPWAWLGGLVFLLVLTFLSWPLLRLWRLGPGEPLRGADVRMISFSFMAAVMVITFLVLDLTFYASISGRFDDLLEPLAKQIKQRFQTEIVDADHQLTEVLKGSGCKPCCPAGSSMSVRTGAYFADLILADSAGHPICRWQAEPDSKQKTWQLRVVDKPPQMALADRSYFRDARRQMLWSLAVGDNECDRGICRVAVDVVSSRISGEEVLVVARPAVGAAAADGSHGQQCPPSRASEQRCQPAVGLIASRMIPFAHPVLPMGYGFAIVNDQGDVQIHSLASRNKQENLFRECDDATGVRAAVGTRMPTRLDVSYSGHEYRIFVTPLNNTPWSLVVFRDRQLLWAANSEIISSWTMLTLLYLAVWVVAAIVLQVCDSTYTAAWLWPCRWGGGARSYWLVAAQTGLLAAVAYLSLQRVEDLKPLGRFVPLFVHFGMVLIFPALTIALACLTLAAGGALGYWEKRISMAVTIAGGLAAGIFIALLLVIFLNSPPPSNYQVPALALFVGLLGALVLINLLRTRAVPQGDAPPGSIADRETETGFRFAYVSMLFSVVVAVAAVPSIVFFQTASDMEVTNLSRMAQMRWVNSLVTRAKQLRAEATEEVSSTIFVSRFDDMKDVYPLDGFPAPIEWQNPGSGRDTDASAGQGHVLLVAGLFNGLGLPEFTPLMSFAAELRMMTSVSDTRKTAPYTWNESAAGGAEVMAVHDDSLHDLLGRTSTWDHLGLPRTGEPGASPAFVRRGFPCFGTANCWSIMAGMALGAAFAGFAVFAALWSIACKLFLLDADVDGDESAATAPVELSREQKLALWHLVRLGFLSPGDGETARVLFRRGVLCRNPAFHVRDAEYKQIQQLDKSEMLAWERQAQPPVSTRLHHMLLPAIALAMTFLFLTQRELFNSAIAVIAALAAVLPTVLKFFSQLGGSPEKS